MCFFKSNKSLKIYFEVLLAASLQPMCSIIYFGERFNNGARNWNISDMSAPRNAQTFTLNFFLSLLSPTLFRIESPAIRIIFSVHFLHFSYLVQGSLIREIH